MFGLPHTPTSIDASVSFVQRTPFYPFLPLSGEIVCLVNKQGKCVHYRFNVDFNSLEGSDAFISGLKHTKQCVRASPGTMLACEVSSSVVCLIIWRISATEDM